MVGTHAPQGTLEAMLEVARRNIGFIEGRNNANPYAKIVGHANYQPWCATFLAAVARRAGVRIPSESAYTPTMSNGFKAEGRWHATGQVGDFVFFHWPSMGRIAHVGIVEEVRPDGTYVCIEGNTDYAGGRTGGRVMRQVRKANIAGFGRPVYAHAPAPSPAPAPPPAPPKPPAPPRHPDHPLLRVGAKGSGVRHLQTRLRAWGYQIAVDGDFGPRTRHAVMAFQARKRLARDGIVGPRTWGALC